MLYNILHITSKSGKNKKLALELLASVFLKRFLPHFDVLCDLFFINMWQHEGYMFCMIRKRKILIVTSSLHDLCPPIDHK